MGPRARVLIGGVVLLANATVACTSWRVQSVAPREFLAREHPGSIRVREHGGATYVLVSPRLEGDSLTGNVKDASRRIPMTAVDNLAVRKFNTLKTLWWAVGVPVLTLGAIVGVGCAVAGCDMNMNFGSWSWTSSY